MTDTRKKKSPSIVPSTSDIDYIINLKKYLESSSLILRKYTYYIMVKA